MNSRLKQIKKRRLERALKQHDMMMRAGMSRQRYQRLESKDNPRPPHTLELIAKGRKSEPLFIPQEKFTAVLSVLNEHTAASSDSQHKKPLDEDPWQGLLGIPNNE